MAYEFLRGQLVRKLVLGLLAIALLVVLTIAWMYCVATANPVVRRTSLAAEGLQTPLKLLLISDVHVGGPDMPPQRLAKIVEQMNELRPDIVLLAGDFISDKRSGTRRYPVSEAVAPLGKFRSTYGTWAVLGNHDHWRDAEAFRRALPRTGVHLLENEAGAAGPITIGGLDDPFTKHDDLGRVVRKMRGMPRPHVLLSHTPDVFPQVSSDVVLTVAGHTHCGQIRLPVGAVSTMSRYGERYACGRIDEDGRTLIVAAGLGTSILPLRLGAVPDVWLIELRPSPRR